MYIVESYIPTQYKPLLKRSLKDVEPWVMGNSYDEAVKSFSSKLPNPYEYLGSVFMVQCKFNKTRKYFEVVYIDEMENTPPELIVKEMSSSLPFLKSIN